MEEHKTTTGLAYCWHNEKASLKDGLVEMKFDLDVYNLGADVVNERSDQTVRVDGQDVEDLHIDAEIAEDFNSDCGDSDELESVYSSDEDGEVERRRYPQFHADTEMDNPSFCMEQIFSDFTTLNKVIKNYSLNNHRPLRKGFLAGCRKVICVDGCFLKTEYGGKLLSAIGIDANSGIFPTAYVVVRIENEDNWTWFLKTLKADLNIPTACEEWMFMSNKQKWSRSYFKTLCKSDLLLNNHYESWNRYILRARNKPTISLFETLRCQIMERFRVKGEFASRNWKGPLCPRIQAKLEMVMKASFNCYTVPNGAMTFEVEVDCKRVVELRVPTCIKLDGEERSLKGDGGVCEEAKSRLVGISSKTKKTKEVTTVEELEPPTMMGIRVGYKTRPRKYWLASLVRRIMNGQCVNEAKADTIQKFMRLSACWLEGNKLQGCVGLGGVVG
ncbi:hypothetical protein LINPERHAP2_LOCUS2858 [Linum perenne]